MTLDWVDRLSRMERRSKPSLGCSMSSLRAASPDHWTNCCITPCRKRPSRIFPCMYVAFYPFFQFATSPNIWTIMLTTSQEITVTNYTDEAREHLKKLITAMGVTFTSSMRGKLQVSKLLCTCHFPFCLPSPSFSRSFSCFPASLPLLSSLFPITNPFHWSASQEQKQLKPSPRPSRY